MQSNEIIFAINEQERIKVILFSPLDNIWRFDFIEALYVKDDVCELLIYTDDELVELLRLLLNGVCIRAFSGKSKLDESIQENLGYMWNVYLDSWRHVRSYQNMPDCISQRYLLRSHRGVAVWFYEKDGKFLFEITPAYKWHSCDLRLKENKGYVPFKQFIENYKPYVITEVSLEALRVWFKQITYLLSLIEFNDNKYSMRDEEDERIYRLYMDMQRDNEETMF